MNELRSVSRCRVCKENDICAMYNSVDAFREAVKVEL